MASSNPVFVVGIDPGTVKGGIAVVDISRNFICWETVNCKGKPTYLSMAREYAEAMNKVLSLKPNELGLVAIEGTIHRRLNKAGRKYSNFVNYLAGYLSGILDVENYELGDDPETMVYYVNPQTWRMTLTESHIANPDQIANAAIERELVSEQMLPTRKSDNHLVDALCVADFGVSIYKRIVANKPPAIPDFEPEPYIFKDE